MRVGVLGPLTLEVHGRRSAIHARKERTLLATLVLRAGKVVPVDVLIDVLWGDVPPRTAGKTLQTYVGKLRRVLSEQRIVTIAPGYRLDLAADELDSAIFEALVRDGQESLRDGDATTAAARLGDALGLWRGEAFEEFVSLPYFEAEVARLEEVRANATEDRIDALLALGQDASLIGQLESLVSERPLRERAWGQLMLALYRSGRQADALHSFQRARRALSEELGLDPGPSLRALERAILAHDQSLVPHTPPTRVTMDGPFPPPTQYARSGNVHLAYQVTGSGPPNVLMINEWWSHVEAVWEHPAPRRFLRRMAGMSRIVAFDGRGSGLSDPIDHDEGLTLEGWMDDALAVLDAAGLGEVVVFGQGTGGAMALLLAVTHPDRVSRLILHNTPTSWIETTPATATTGDPEQAFDAVVETVGARWGHGPGYPIAPSYSQDPEFEAWFGRLQRMAVSPGQLPARLRMVVDADVRGLAPSVTTPTLVLHTTGNRIVPVAVARRLAVAIPGAQLVEMDSDDHIWFWGDGEETLDHVSAFLAQEDLGTRVERVLVTIVSLDVDERTPRYDDTVQRVVDRYRGRVLERADGSLMAVFDGPARAVSCARLLLDAAVRQRLIARAGIHTGEVDHGPGMVAGTAVEIAEQVGRIAQPGQVWVSRTVVDLVAGSGLQFVHQGSHPVTGLDRPCNLYTVAAPA